MTKQEAIQQAYGVHWETVKDYVDENGWIFEYNTTPSFENEVESSYTGMYLRPITLQGIEDNNGWIELKGEPNEIGLDDDMWILANGVVELCPKEKTFASWYATHYQPITKPKPPIY